LLVGHERLRTAGAGEETTAAATTAAAPCARWSIGRSASWRTARSRRKAAATAATAATEATAIRGEDAEQERKESRIRARLLDHRIASRLDRLGLAALERLVGGDGREALRIHVGDVFHTGRSRPPRSAAVRHAAREREARVGRPIVGEQS